MLQHLKKLTKQLGRLPRGADFEKFGKFSLGAYNRNFRSLNRALFEAGLTENPEKNAVSKDELLNELRRLHEELGKVPQIKDINQHGIWKLTKYYASFGSLANALEEAGIKENVNTKSIDREELIEDLKRIYKKIGRVPRLIDLDEHSKYSKMSYFLHFDGFREALLLAGLKKPKE